MTYESDVEGGRTHRVGYYVAVDGIASRLATHDMGDFGLSGTYLPVITEGSLRGGGTRLDRARGIVLPATFGFSMADTSAVRAIIRRRGGTEDTLELAINSTQALIETGSGSQTWADGTVVHIGREAITLGTWSGGSGGYGSSVRGAHNTLAYPHLAGAVISDAPRHWYDRRAVLYAVNLDTGTEQAIRAGVISSVPKFENGLWQVEVTDLMTVLNRPIMHGWDEVPVESVATQTVTVNGSDTDGVRMQLSDYRQIQDDGFIAISYRGRVGVYYVYSGDLNTSNYVDVSNTSWRAGDVIAFDGDNGLAAAGSGEVSVRQVGRYSEAPWAVALQVMLSIVGDGTNDATWDVLPGRSYVTTTTEDLSAKRVGAGIPAAWVASSGAGTWNTHMGAGGEGTITGIIDEKQRLFDFLTNEILWRSGGFAYISVDGKLSFQLYKPAHIRAGVDTLGRDELGHVVSVWDAEDEVPGRAELECNYIIGQGYQRKVEVIWEDNADLYGEHGRDQNHIRLQTKSLWVDGTGVMLPGVALATQPMPVTSVLLMLDRLRSRVLVGGRRARVRLPWTKHVDTVIGKQYSLTDDRMPDLEGGSGVTSRVYEVVGVDMDFQSGFIEAELEEVIAGAAIAPSCIVGSYASTTITIDTTGPEAGMYDSNPGSDFAADWVVRIYDASASPPYSSSTTATISSVTASTIVLTSTPSPTPAAGDIVTVEDGADSGNTNADGADVQDFAFGADSSFTVGSPARDGPKWG